MSALYRIDKKEIRDLLGKGWLTHDGMWFYNTYQELGVEKANKCMMYEKGACSGDIKVIFDNNI